MYFSFTPKFVQHLMPQLQWRVEDAGNSLYLTFDDGPIPEVTPWVLDILAKWNAKATFFCVGENIIKHPEIFEQLKSEGHSIGSHTHNHLSGWSSSNRDYLRNVTQAATLANSSLFRPPYGRITPMQVRLLKNRYKIVMWDVLSGDFDPAIEPQDCLDNVIRNTRSGSIIVFHDSIKARKNLEYALPKILEHFCTKGYVFSSLKNSITEQENAAVHAVTTMQISSMAKL
ncbi:MAG TPA: polysaccharide deacetylase family protein [Saprospiraceae bacterium]|nr:polysaccharide deacetylase family protein [Saprospiraceae bacterium]